MGTAVEIFCAALWFSMPVELFLPVVHARFAMPLNCSGQHTIWAQDGDFEFDNDFKFDQDLKFDEDVEFDLDFRPARDRVSSRNVGRQKEADDSASTELDSESDAAFKRIQTCVVGVKHVCALRDTRTSRLK